MELSPLKSTSSHTRKVLAAFDEEGIDVYQAFGHAIADEALRLQTFGRGFNVERMTWIKPSFGWMLHRSQYATLARQERILRIRIRHDGFLGIISRAIPTSFNPALCESEFEWRNLLKRAEVRYQWDPDRDLYHRKLDRRAIQLGMRGIVVEQYVKAWIVRIVDVTSLARAIKKAVEDGESVLPPVPIEREYPLPPEVVLTLGMESDPSRTTPRLNP